MLVFAKGQKYSPTAEDRLWLLRAVEAEGQPRLAVARALVNLFGLGRSRGDKKTLAQLVRLYAQPVNPRWYPDGDLFLAKGPPTEEELRKAERRRDYHSTRNVFTAETIAAVNEALNTQYSGDITDYAVPAIDASKKGYVARSEPQKGVNRLWTRKPGWAGYQVSNSPDFGVGGLVAIAIAVYTAYKVLHG